MKTRWIFSARVRVLLTFSLFLTLAACAKAYHRPVKNNPSPTADSASEGDATSSKSPPLAIPLGKPKRQPTENEVKTLKVRQALSFLIVDKYQIESGLTTDRATEAEKIGEALLNCGLKSQQLACALDADPKYQLMRSSSETLVETKGIGLYTVTYRLTEKSRISYVFHIEQIEPEVKTSGVEIIKDGHTLLNLTVNQDLVDSALKRIPARTPLAMVSAARMAVSWLFIQRTKGIKIEEPYKNIVRAIEGQGQYLASQATDEMIKNMVDLVEAFPEPVPKEFYQALANSKSDAIKQLANERLTRVAK